MLRGRLEKRSVEMEKKKKERVRKRSKNKRERKRVRRVNWRKVNKGGKVCEKE